MEVINHINKRCLKKENYNVVKIYNKNYKNIVKI